MMNARSQRGGMLPLIIACVAVLVVILLGAFSLQFIFSDEQKVRSVVDSGALMLANHAPEQKIKPSKLFEDCADTSGMIGIMNINRVIGKAMLINLNAEDMKNSSQTGNSEGSASSAMQAADDTASQVKDKVTDAAASKTAFDQAAPSKGGAGGASTGDGSTGGAPAPVFDSSFVHRNDESNLTIDESQLPPSIKLPKDATIQVGGAGTYMRGYKGVKANEQDFYFLPFRQKELPHLIPIEEFAANKKEKKPLGWGSAIPNAYQVTANGGISPNMLSVAAAVANPQQHYNLAIPHAYVSIKLHPTQVTWKVNGKPVSVSQYYFEKEQQNGVKKYDVQCAKLDGFASLGNEYKSQTLYAIMNEAVPGDHEQMMKVLSQRLKEIDPGFSGLQKLLEEQQVGKDELEFLIYPEYQEKDNTDPKIRIATKSGAGSGWLDKNAIPDGAAKQIGTETMTDAPNSSWCVPIGTWKLSKATVKVDGKIMWTPSTGANQHLGEIEILRTCTVNFEGKCP